MARFFGKLLLFVSLSAILIGLTVWINVAVVTREVDRVYDIPSDVDVLFLGSSQIGCSVVEKEEFHNFVLWSSRRAHYSFYARLLELERRNALDRIKTCVVYFNPQIVCQQTPDIVNRSWWGDFYLSGWTQNLYPTTVWSKILWACSNLSMPMAFSVREDVPGGRISIPSHDAEWRRAFYDEITNVNSVVALDQLVPNWKYETCLCYKRILETCKRHGIRCVFVDFPVLRGFYAMFSERQLEAYREIRDWLVSQGAECVELEKTYGEECYFDNVHMVEPMSELYTRDLYELLNLPIRVARRP